jgi:hypothetical protein
MAIYFKSLLKAIAFVIIGIYFLPLTIHIISYSCLAHYFIFIVTLFSFVEYIRFNFLLSLLNFNPMTNNLSFNCLVYVVFL